MDNTVVIHSLTIHSLSIELVVDALRVEHAVNGTAGQADAEADKDSPGQVMQC